MAQALADILNELNPTYDPQRASNQAQQTALDPQQSAEAQGLDQTKQSAFSDITNQANRNGLFYSGLPISEEQKYIGGTYLPAIANLHAKYTQQRFGLQDALSKINADQQNQAYGIRQNQLDTEEKQREFDRQLAAQQAADAANRAAAARAAGSGASPSFLPTSNPNNPPPSPAANTPVVPAGLQALYNRMFFKPGGGTWSNQDLVNDYNATYKSASYGNQADLQKLELYHSIRPDLFGTASQPFPKQSTPQTVINTGSRPAGQQGVSMLAPLFKNNSVPGPLR